MAAIESESWRPERLRPAFDAESSESTELGPKTSSEKAVQGKTLGVQYCSM